MRWGFGWELGPFETWDAIGVAAVADACQLTAPPPLVARALADGAFRPAAAGNSPAGGSLPSGKTASSRQLQMVRPAGAGLQILGTAKERSPVVRRNPGASLIDLGDDVLAVEFHSKMNAIGGDTIDMLRAGVKEASANYRALVVGNDALHFSAGANLMLLLLEAQEENWEDVDLMVRAFQGATMALKYADVPVVVAPAGMVLGGGCEIVLHGDRVQAAAESYIGLVEVGVGLIPAGGGTKEMLARATAAAGPGADLLALTQRVFETIGFARVSTSGADARRLGYLRAVDGITMNRERLMADAKAVALARAQDYVRPQPLAAIPVGGDGVQAALKLGVHLAWRAGRISDHDALIGRALAKILAGGDRPGAGTASEQQLLDLEREAFLSLCGQRKTQERIAHTLKTGKTLRNWFAARRRDAAPVEDTDASSQRSQGAGRQARGHSRRTRHRGARARRGGLRAPAPAVRRHDAHQDGVPGRQGAGADWLRRAALQLSAASAPARARSIGARGRRKTSAPRSTTWRRTIPARRSGPPVSRSDRGSRSRSAPSILESRR